MRAKRTLWMSVLDGLIWFFFILFSFFMLVVGLALPAYLAQFVDIHFLWAYVVTLPVLGGYTGAFVWVVDGEHRR